jgi:WD40 repeat protein
VGDHDRAIGGVRFNPRGGQLFTGGANGKVVVWDMDEE